MTRLMRTRLTIPLLALAVVGCAPVEQQVPRPPEQVAEPTTPNEAGRDPQAPDRYQVQLDTTKGQVVIEVDRSLAPRGADRFYRLVNEGFYDGAKFFRVVEGFVVQFGMAADPQVNARWQEARIRDDPVRGSNTRGTVTFATSGPHSRTAQVFINLVDNQRLDEMGFAPFGRVVEGMEVVDRFYSGYGEAPDQGQIAARGNAYLEQRFPELDAIKTARIVRENGEPVENAGASGASESPENADPLPE
jgi:peptidyl-prolyl cis-trans isomerase A (cyclophilin A)